MAFRSRRRCIPLAIVVGLIISVFVPAVALGQNDSANSQAALGEIITAAESAEAYANETVMLAAAHGVSVSSAQSQLSQGDSLLAQAKSDAQAGAMAAGTQAAQASMAAYAGAAAAASLALTNAGFSLGTDYEAAVSAATEVNATLSVVAAVSARACGSAGGVIVNSSTCSQASAQISAARTDLDRASSLLVQSSGQENASGTLPQALSLIAGARNQAQAAVLTISTLAAHTYSQRAQAYVSAVVDPLAAQANYTVESESSVNSSFSQLQADYTSYSGTQESSIGAVTGSASTLTASIAAVDVNGVDASSASAEAVATQVETNLSALLALPGVTLQAGVVSDIKSCQSALSSYAQSVDAVVSGTDAFQSTKISAFQAYTASLGQNASEVGAMGGAYVSAYGRVLSDLASILGVPGVSAIYGNLSGLQVSGSVNGLDASLAAAVSTVTTVQSDAAAFAGAVTAQAASVTLSTSLLDNASADVAAAVPFLSGTGASAMSNVSSSLLGVQRSSGNFAGQAGLMTNETVGLFGAAAAALATDGGDVVTETNATGGAISAAAGYLASDLAFRASMVAAAQGELGTALELFSELDVSGGTSAIAQASIDFHDASSVNAS